LEQAAIVTVTTVVTAMAGMVVVLMGQLATTIVVLTMVMEAVSIIKVVDVDT
jgi:hypothetical protein